MIQRGVHCPGSAAPVLFATISATSTLDDTELLKLDVHVPGHSVVALVDSRASHCFISDTIAAHCRLKVDPTQ